MQKQIATVTFGLILFGCGLAIGVSIEDLMATLVQGPEVPMIVTADIELHDEENCGRAGIGGIKAGLPVRVRRHGPVSSITASFRVVDFKPPLREISPADADALERQLRCSRNMSALDDHLIRR